MTRWIEVLSWCAFCSAPTSGDQVGHGHLLQGECLDREVAHPLVGDPDREDEQTDAGQSQHAAPGNSTEDARSLCTPRQDQCHWESQTHEAQADQQGLSVCCQEPTSGDSHGQPGPQATSSSPHQPCGPAGGQEHHQRVGRHSIRVHAVRGHGEQGQDSGHGRSPSVQGFTDHIQGYGESHSEQTAGELQRMREVQARELPEPHAQCRVERISPSAVQGVVAVGQGVGIQVAVMPVDARGYPSGVAQSVEDGPAEYP